MNWPANRLISKLALAATGLGLAGCGVKGDPLPPERPVEMGRGRPTYQRATKKIMVEKDPGDGEERN